MKILHVLSGPRAEGTPRLVLDWLTVKQYDQELLFLTADGELKDEFKKFPNWQSYNNTVFKFRNAHKIVDLVKRVCLERKPGLVISWAMGFSQWVHLGAHRAGVRKLITHAGNAPGQSFMGRYTFTYLTCWIGSLVNSKVVCCSNYVRDEYLKIPFLSRKSFVSVYNCFRVEKFRAIGEQKNGKQAIMVATLEPHKDHTSLLHAWKIIEGRDRSMRLLIAGAGSLETDLKDLLAKLQLTTVEFLGSRTDVPRLLSTSSVFVFSTTTQEGFGTALLEAMAAECIIVASRVPACTELLVDGRYGMLVAPHNPQELADGILRAFTAKLTSEQLTDRNKYLSQFSPESMIERYLQVAE